MRVATWICGIAAALVTSAPTSHAQSPAEFYKGKNVELYIGYSVGGAYDLYARVIARHLGKHIPGNPTVTPKNMEGAGSLRLANWLYNVAPKDGTVFGTIGRGTGFDPLLGHKTAQFEGPKFSWIGSANDEVSVCVVWNGRSKITKFEDLLTLTPGVSVVQGPDGDEITFSGQRGVFNNISLDGGDYNNGFFGEQVGGQRAAVDITLDAVKEFQVVANGAAAEFGRTAGGVVNVITKSGTNVLHGSGFEFMRDDSLNAANAFSAVGPDGKRRSDGLRRDQFGGTLGGPIVPGKLFYFAGYQATRVNVTPTSFFQFVPTAAMLAGDFSAFTSPACNSGRSIALRARPIDW